MNYIPHILKIYPKVFMNQEMIISLRYKSTLIQSPQNTEVLFHFLKPYPLFARELSLVHPPNQ